MTTERRQGARGQRGSHQSKRAASTTAPAGKSPNEGEGSRSAARDYNERTEKFIESGRVERSAEEAKRALDGGERDELLDAERAGRESGKQHSGNQ
jgi:hypothetical protein